MDTLQFTGITRHHFWGSSEPMASLILAVEGVRATDSVTRHLDQLVHQLQRVAPHLTFERSRRYVVVYGTHAELQPALGWIEERRHSAVCSICQSERRNRGPWRHDLLSMDHSIDQGPAFWFALQTEDLVTPNLPFPQTV